MNSAVQRFGAWSGVIYIVNFCVAMALLAGMIPALPPSWDVAHVSAFYHDRRLGIGLAAALMVFAVPLGFSWTATVATWTAKIEGGLAVLSWSQVMCGVFSFGGAYIGAISFAIGAFRPERSGELVQFANDQGWFWMIMPGSCAVMQCVFIGIAILCDKRPEPIFPRWVGFFNVWVGVLQIPGDLVCLFHDGPFAWNGLFAFWIPLTVFSLWIYVDTWALLRAIKRVRMGQLVLD